MNQNQVFALLNKECIKVEKSLPKRDLEEFYTVEMRGSKFNVLPFLINGLQYHVPDRYLVDLYEAVASESKKDFLVEYNAKGKVLALCDSMLRPYQTYSFTNGVIELCYWLDDVQPYKLAKILYRVANKMASEIVTEKEQFRYLTYKNKKICNTQAFSYYLYLYWLVDKSNMVFGLLKPYLKGINIREKIYEMCPEESIHFQYIKGELDEKQLAKKYKNEVYVFEVLSNLTDGEYNKERPDVNDYMIAESLSNVMYGFSVNRLSKMIAYASVYTGHSDGYNQENKKLKEKIVRQDKKLNDNANVIRDKRKNIEELKKEKEKFRKIAVEQARQLKEMPTYDKLNNKIDELHKEVKEYRKSEEELISEKVSLKREIATQKKVIKRLEAKLESLDLDEEEISEVEDLVNDEVSVEVALEAIKDKKICIVGGLGVTGYDTKLKEYGLHNITWTNKNNQCKGEYDIGVILASNAKHCTVRKMEKELKDTPIIYLNGTNIERFIIEIYNKLIEED